MMSDKTLQERLRYPDWWMDDTLNEEAADALDDKENRIAELESRSKRWDSINQSIAQQRDELAAALRLAEVLLRSGGVQSWVCEDISKALAKLDGDA